MEPKENRIIKEIVKFITNRQLITFAVVAVSFYLLLARLFYLQIVEGESKDATPSAMRTRTAYLYPERGGIYDRLGRPLAVNKSSVTLVMDASVTKPDAAVIHELIKILERHDESIIDQFPISKTEPFTFDFWGTGKTEEQWKLDMDIVTPTPTPKPGADKEGGDPEDSGEESAGVAASGEEGDEPVEAGEDPEDSDEAEAAYSPDATECFHKLRAFFGVDESLSNDEARKILNLCTMLYMQRYQSWIPITIVYEAKLETISEIMEDRKFAGITADTKQLREYPEGKYFASIVGYIGKITSEQYNLLEDEGYFIDDEIGQAGIEYAMETELRGEVGKVDIEVTAADKILSYFPIEKPAQPGEDVFLTLDRDLQVKSFDILEDMLAQALIGQIKGGSAIKFPISMRQLFSSMIKSSVYSITGIMSTNDDSSSPSLAVKQYVLAKAADSRWTDNAGRSAIRLIISEGIENGDISSAQMMSILLEQGVITGDEKFRQDLADNKVNIQSAVIERLESGELTPQMTNLDPCTGSIAVVDVKTGGLLAAVGYPSFDSNKFVNDRDYEYYVKVVEDATLPMTNRPFKEVRAPGSTFKMISAIAALEYGSITPATRIYDAHTFTLPSGTSVLNCWSAISHGSINVSEALEVSCNYFFAEAAYRMGNMKSDTQLNAIAAMNEYMAYFGLGQPTGVEIGETIKQMSSPEYKNEIGSGQPWFDGDTVQTAIGQNLNSYSTASMAKYIATLASKGTRYKLHLVDSIRGADGKIVDEVEPVVEIGEMPISEETWDAVYKGMLLVTSGPKGTGVAAFADFPFNVAGKTGTAEEDGRRNDHSSFGGFAPFESPEIAVYVSIPYGDNKAVTSFAAQIARKVMEEYFGLDSAVQRPEPKNVLAR
ncbi:MAG: hypothetical protein LBU32_30170 [Clostridiales bacterium]|jgi:cell division protein FtsI/penicillin-binding protein 2|nr:hypothetical protein [Clostridiales bacterium]